jgi:hypothetical protein
MGSISQGSICKGLSPGLVILESAVDL